MKKKQKRDINDIILSLAPTTFLIAFVIAMLLAIGQGILTKYASVRTDPEPAQQDLAEDIRLEPGQQNMSEDIRLEPGGKVFVQAVFNGEIFTIESSISALSDQPGEATTVIKDTNGDAVMSVPSGNAVAYSNAAVLPDGTPASDIDVGRATVFIEMPDGNIVMGKPSYFAWRESNAAALCEIGGMLYQAPASRIGIMYQTERNTT